jgi:hypothetical protein
VAPAADPPFVASEFEWSVSPAPSPGEHTEEFFREELGIGNDELEKLRAAGVV